MSGSRFLERWSRLKRAADKVAEAEITDAGSLLENLTPDSDFGQFMRHEISEEVRRKAMKTLFSDPHFNVMDGLDIYIDDYSISDPIPEEMLASLEHAKGLLFNAPEQEDEAADSDILSADGQNVPPFPAPPGSTSENQ
ncbi:MAG: DUF3306 domain-containing protein [Betaproteobacteria bacterium]